jgi:hypothetical protein
MNAAVHADFGRLTFGKVKVGASVLDELLEESVDLGHDWQWENGLEKKG